MPRHEFCSVSSLQSGCNIFLREPHEVLSSRQGHCPSGCGGFHICLDLVLWCIMFFPPVWYLCGLSVSWMKKSIYMHPSIFWPIHVFRRTPHCRGWGKGFAPLSKCGGLRLGTGFTLLYYFALVVEATPCNGKLCVFWFRRCLEALQGFDSPCFLWLNIGKDSCQSRQSSYNCLMSDVGRTKP